MAAQIPDLDRYRRHLLKTVGFLRGHPETQLIPGLGIALSNSERQLGSSRDGSWKFATTPEWTFPLDWMRVRPGISPEVWIGADIQVERGELRKHVTVVTIVTKGTRQGTGPPDSCCIQFVGDSPRVVRRVHFDTDNSTGRSPRPVTHLQLGGRMPQTGGPPGPHYCFDQYLDLPRIPTAPMDPVLVLEFVWDQLPCKGLSTLVKESTWVGLVKASEQFWSLPYHRGLARYLAASGKGLSHYEFQKGFETSS
jgi:hypothetical protein